MSPAVFTIPAGESFVDALARRLLAENADQPLALADTLILLPTRRACRTAQDAFLRMGGGRPLLVSRRKRRRIGTTATCCRRQCRPCGAICC